MNTIPEFLNTLKSNIERNEFAKLTLGNKRNKSSELKNVFVKAAMLKSGLHLSCIYRYPTNDITKNYTVDEALLVFEELLKAEFFNADMFSSTGEWHLLSNKNNNIKIVHKATVAATAPIYSHDHIKNRLIQTENNIYLQELGITTADFKVKKDMQDKYRQINKYTEIVEGIVNSAYLKDKFTVVDMGSGKGYLTFALYDYLKNTLKLDPTVIGIELRKELVEKCNSIAKKANYENLKFEAGTIQEAKIPVIDMLIALHACNTATDDAIARGLKANASVIICAPCCHKQIRKEINPSNDLKQITKFGILEERQAELLTDGIRALILEAYGYKTKVFEFISTEHTPKNVLIVGTRSKIQSEPNQEIIAQIQRIKEFWGIEYHHLERLLGIS